MSVLIGGQISKSGTFAKAEVGYGTAFKARAEVGHEFNIGKNMGLELSANAAYTKATEKSSYNATTTFTADNQVQTMSMINKWYDGFQKAGGALMMTFNGKRGNVKAGVEVGSYSNKAPNIATDYHAAVMDDRGNSGTLIYHDEYKGHRNGAYVTPRVSAELNLGQKGNWSFVANADKFGGNAGVRFTF